MNARHGALIFHLQSRPRTPFLSHRKTLPFSLFLLNSSVTQRRENYPGIIGLITDRERPGKESSRGCRQGLPDRRARAGAWLLGSSWSPSERCSGHRVPRGWERVTCGGSHGSCFRERRPLHPLPLGAGLGRRAGMRSLGCCAQAGARSCFKRLFSNAGGGKKIIPDGVKSHT